MPTILGSLPTPASNNAKYGVVITSNTGEQISFILSISGVAVSFNIAQRVGKQGNLVWSGPILQSGNMQVAADATDLVTGGSLPISYCDSDNGKNKVITVFNGDPNPITRVAVVTVVISTLVPGDFLQAIADFSLGLIADALGALLTILLPGISAELVGFICEVSYVLMQEAFNNAGNAQVWAPGYPQNLNQDLNSVRALPQYGNPGHTTQRF